MKRLAIACLLLAAACVKATAPANVDTLVVTGNGSADGVFVGDAIQLSTAVYDYLGVPVTVPVTYQSSNNSLATVSATGLIAALAPGKVTITVLAAGQTANIPFTIDANITKSVGITPQAFSLRVGTTTIVQAFIATTQTNPARNKTVLWTSADATKATVDSLGIVTGKAVTAGVNICATVTDGSGIQGCAVATIIP